MKLYQILAITTIVFASVACQNTEDKKIDSKETASFSGHKATVTEVIDGKTYTYLNINENNADMWIAISRRDTKVGEVLYFTDALEMTNFESKELGKTFDKILFVSAVSNDPTNMGGTSAAHGMMKNSTQENVSVEPAKGGITVEELYKNKDSYKGKTVIMKGKVTKFNKEIMNRNWVHIQDGTSNGKNIDITITTKDMVKLGDVVTFKGVITLSKDFGAGYFYDVIMENASVIDAK